MAVNNKINITVEAKDKTSKALKKMSGRFNSLGQTIKNNTQNIKRIGIGLAGVATTAGVVGKQLFDLGGDIEQTLNKAHTVFGEYFDDMDKFAETTAKSMGLSRNEYLKAAAGMADLLKPMGFTTEEAATQTQEMVALSGALAEWSNGQYTSAQASEIVSKAMLGETEQLKTMGIAIDQSSKQFNERIKTMAEDRELTLQQAKALDIQRQILEKSTDAQEAFAEGGDTIARKQAEMTASINNSKEALATALIPAFNDLLIAMEPVVDDLTQTIELWAGNKENIDNTVKSIKSAAKFFKIVGGSIAFVIKSLYNLGKVLGLIAADIVIKVSGLMKSLQNVGNSLGKLGKNIVSLFRNFGASAFNLIKNAKQWGANLVDMMVAGIKGKISAVGDAVKGVANTIKDFLGFSSPTKKGPASNSDKWMPNLIKMMEQGLRGGKGKFSKAAAELSTVLVNEFGKTGNFEKIQGVLDNLQIQFQQSFQGIKSNIDSSKANIQGLTNEIKGLEDQLKRVDESMAQLDASTEKSVAERVVELEKQLQSGDLSREEEVAKQKELDFAREKTTLEEIQAIKQFQALNETEKILRQAELRREEFEEEKLRIEEELNAKENALSKELNALADLYAQKNTLEIEYHSLYMTNIESRMLKTKESIALLERLNAMRESESSGGGGVDGARALGGTVASNKTYLVGERGPELFTPSTTGNITPNNQLGSQANNITINMGGVTVQNEADEDRLIDKIKKNLIRETQLFNNGIV